MAETIVANAGKTSRRRWTSFSLRALLVGLTLAGLVFGWLAMRVDKARRQQRAVAKIQQLRGYVTFDYGRNTDGTRAEGDAHFGADPPLLTVPSAMSWPRDLLGRFVGDEYVRSVTMVNLCREQPTAEDLDLLRDLPDLVGLFLFENQSVDDTSLAHVPQLPMLQDLDLSQTSVTDAGLAHLVKFPNLKQLFLTQSAIGDDGLAFLGQIGSLELLDLRFSAQITDQGLAHLAHLKNLRELDLRGSSITDRGLVHLAELTQLETLGLGETQITGDGLSVLASMKNLELLRLDGTGVTDQTVTHLATLLAPRTTITLDNTRITDAALAEIAKLESLKWLSLSGNELTGAGLAQLAPLTSLEALVLPVEGITSAGIIRLQLALPNCNITTR